MADMRVPFRHFPVKHVFSKVSSIFYINTQFLLGPSDSQQLIIYVVQLQTVANTKMNASLNRIRAFLNK